MTLTEVQAALALAKAAYSAALEGGEEMMWEDRRIRLLSPDEYFREIQRLERLEHSLSVSTRKGHNIAFANFNNTRGTS